MSDVVALEDGRRIKYKLKQRTTDPFWMVRFRGPDGRDCERSTKEKTSLRAAHDSACAIIREEYAPKKPQAESPAWEYAIGRLRAALQANNLREGSQEQFFSVLRVLRRMFPNTHGPADISTAIAEEFKFKRLSDQKLSPFTVEGNLIYLNTIWKEYWIKMKLLTENPWAAVEHPKTDKKEPRRLERAEIVLFLNWLADRFAGWRLPRLFIEVKAELGCRIGELCWLPTANLKDGKVRFEAEYAKGRRWRVCKLTPALYGELVSIAGPSWVWEKFNEQRRQCQKKHRQCGNLRREFSPRALLAWFQQWKTKFLKEHPEVPWFKLHNFRATALSRAWDAEISPDKAAVFYGCHPETARKHYIGFDAEKVADEVFERLHPKAEPPVPDEKRGENGGILDR